MRFTGTWRSSVRRAGVLKRVRSAQEAAKRCPEAVRAQFPDIAWRGMAGLRDVLIHDYDGVDPEEVVPILTGHLPQLRLQLVAALASLDQ